MGRESRIELRKISGANSQNVLITRENERNELEEGTYCLFEWLLLLLLFSLTSLYISTHELTYV